MQQQHIPSTLPQPTFTRQTFTKSNNISTSQQHPSPQIHSSNQPTRSVHKNDHVVACSTSHDNPSQVMLPKYRPLISPRSNHPKITALVKPSPRTSNVANNEQQRINKQPPAPTLGQGSSLSSNTIPSINANLSNEMVNDTSSRSSQSQLRDFDEQPISNNLSKHSKKCL